MMKTQQDDNNCFVHYDTDVEEIPLNFNGTGPTNGTLGNNTDGTLTQPHQPPTSTVRRQLTYGGGW